jgi:hypothetical protein
VLHFGYLGSVLMNKYCQGPKCHTYMTTDRKRGIKGSKYYQTRTVGRYGYGDGSFCTMNCQGDWWAKHGTRAIDHFGRLHEPIRLVPENAWVKDYDYEYINNTSVYTHHFKNKLTDERILLTEAQYNDNDYTIERIRG